MMNTVLIFLLFVSFFVMILMLYVFQVRMRQVMEQAAKNEQALAESNKQLQSEVERHQLLQTSLQFSEDKYRQLVESLPIGIFRTTFDKNNRFLAANQALVDMLEADSLDMLMQHPVSRYYDNPDEHIKIIETFRVARAIENRQTKLVTLRGNRFWSSITAVMQHDENNNPYFEGVIINVTERVIAQSKAEKRAAELEAIRQANLSLTASLDLETVLNAILESTLKLSENANNAFAFVYEHGRLTYGAASWAKVENRNRLVQPRDEGTTYQVARSGKSIIIADMETHPNYETSSDNWQGALASLPLKIGKRVVGVMNIHCQDRHKWQDAELRLLHLLADQAAIAIENARLYQQAQREIEARKQIESAIWGTLAQSEALYNFTKSLIVQESLQEMLQTATDHAVKMLPASCVILALCDTQKEEITHFVLSGDEIEDTLVVSFEDLAQGIDGWVLDNQEPVLFLGHESDPYQQALIQRQYKTNHGIIVVPLQYRQKAWGTMTAINKQEGVNFIQQDVELMVTMANSISIAIENVYLYEQAQQELKERKRAEKALKQTHNELTLHVAELTKANEELESFTYLMSHDLKTPLNGIVRISEWLEDDLGPVLTGESVEHMNLLRRRVYRLEALINETMRYLRLRRNRGEIKTINVGNLLEQLVSSLCPPSFSVKIGEGMPTFVTNVVSLEEVFRNLISNVVKHHHRPHAGMIHITVSDEIDFFRFTVADNGPGIAPEFHKKVFIIFKTLQSRDELESSGIGLALAKRLVENQGGTIWLESREGQGATFCFTWRKTLTIDKK